MAGHTIEKKENKITSVKLKKKYDSNIIVNTRYNKTDLESRPLSNSVKDSIYCLID